MSMIRIAVVGDIHHGRDTRTKRGSAALPLLDRFIDEINSASFDAVIDLGDRISDESAERDRELLAEVATRFERLRAPRHHINGNHDRATLSELENAGILGCPTNSRTVDVGDLRLAFWQPNVRPVAGKGLQLAPGDLDELAALLEGDDRRTLLVSHVPLSGHSQAGNYYFENNPGHATYAEVDQVREVIDRAACSIVALAGHVHWNTLTVVDGTPHLTLQSLTETFTVGDACGASAVLEVDGEALRWTVHGRDPLSLTLPWPTVRPRWRRPLPPFHAATES